MFFGPERPAVSDWASALSWGRDEAELVHELQAGSETAFDWLVTHYHAPVYNLILGMLGDTSDAADGTQEVFLKAFRGIRSFRQGSSLKTWLYRIAIREALNHKRWFKRHLQKNVSIDAEPEVGKARIEIEDLGATPFEQLAAQEIRVAVQGALQQSPMRLVRRRSTSSHSQLPRRRALVSCAPLSITLRKRIRSLYRRDLTSLSRT
jgi:RNA polymerase sigma-70 factor (ECF subfamily)